MAIAVHDPAIDALAQRLARLEGWQEAQASLSEFLGEHLKGISERLAGVEAQLRHLDERSDARFAELRSELRAELQAAEGRWNKRLAELDSNWNARFAEQDLNWDKRFNEQNASWEKRFNDQDARWEKRFGELRADIRGAEERWETRFGQLTSRLWWLFGFQFTILLALVALLTKAFTQ